MPPAEILAHIAPIAFGHMNFRGIYRFALERYMDRLVPSMGEVPIYVPFTAVTELALAMSACAMRMLAMSMSLPSKDTAPRPSLAACAMASTIYLAAATRTGSSMYI